MTRPTSYLAGDRSAILMPNVQPAEIPHGFRFAGVNCGIKSTRPDLAVILCPPGTAAAACLTQNKLAASCVMRNAQLFPHRDLRAVVINSGNANAMTGVNGHQRNDQIAEHSAAVLGCEVSQVATCSTGVIGVPLPVDLICDSLKSMFNLANASPEGLGDCAQAILTTDTCKKIAVGTATLNNGEAVRVIGFAKGSGMIHPNMATTLAYVCIEAKIDADHLQSWLRLEMATTFNAITVDGDCSTNDMVIALASSNRTIPLQDDEREHVLSVAAGVLERLAISVVQDGEGATRLLELHVRGTQTDIQAREMARSMARNTLFRCSAFAGSTSGWGRLAAAIGQTGFELNVEIDSSELDIAVAGNLILGRGQPQALGLQSKAKIERLLQSNKVVWEVRLGSGPGKGRVTFCDLSYDYIRINADEESKICVGPQGNVYRHLGLNAYSPTLKHQLLVDALGYAKRFAGLRVLIYACGSVLKKERLLAAFTRDLRLMSEVDIRAFIVVPDHEDAEYLIQDNALLIRYCPTVDSVSAIANTLDRGQSCLSPLGGSPSELINLGILLGMEKIVVISDGAGLSDRNGSISGLSIEQAREGIQSGNLHAEDLDSLELVKEAVAQHFPALHLIDGRVPHAIVGELFTDEGVGTLVTRKRIDEKLASVLSG